MNIDDSLLTELATIELVIDALQQRSQTIRTKVAAGMRPGNRLHAVSPLDESVHLGTISMTKPDRQAYISDKAAFADWVKKTYPDKVRNDFKVIASDKEVISALYLHKREYLGDNPIVDSDFENDVRAKSKEFGKPVGPNNELDVPGVSVQTPKAVLRCLPDPAAASEVIALLQAGGLSLESLVFDDAPTAPESEVVPETTGTPA